MEKTATYLADVIRGVGVLAGKLKDIPVLGNLNVGMIPIVGSYIELLRKAGTQTGTLTAADNAHLKSLQDSFKITTKTVKSATTLAKLSAQQLKDLRLKTAIDKANLALNKGTNVFDIEAIQNNAALINQAELLAKTTNGSQLLQIANDVARLNVKKSIYELEQAIAAGDVKGIETATAKLNKDLAILSTLTAQKYTMADIKSILDGLQPKSLIDIANLKEALALLEAINLASTGSKTKPAGIATTAPATAPSTAGLVPATTIAQTNANVASLGGVVTQIQPNLKEYTPNTGMLSGISPNGREFNFTVNVNTGIGDPNAIAEAVTQVIQDAVDRGTLRGGAY
jgi:hypothetical protein